MNFTWYTISICILLLTTGAFSTVENEEFIAKSLRNETKPGKSFTFAHSMQGRKIEIFLFKVVGVKIGQSEVPDARPEAEDRLFISETVEAVILDVGSRIKDDAIRTIFSNCLPSTLGNTSNRSGVQI